MELDYSEIGRRIARRRRELGLRIALALDTTPDEFLIGSIWHESEEWRDVAELLREMDLKQLRLTRSLLTWLSEQKL